MQHLWSGNTGLCLDRALDDTGGQFGALYITFLPTDDLAADDVEDQIEGNHPIGPAF